MVSTVEILDAEAAARDLASDGVRRTLTPGSGGGTSAVFQSPISPESSLLAGTEQAGDTKMDGEVMTLVAAAEYYKLQPHLVHPLATAFDADPTQTDAEDFACLTDEEVKDAVDSMLVDGREVKPLERASIRKFIKKLREFYEPEPQPSDATPAKQQPTSIVLPKGPDVEKLEYTICLAQGVSGSCRVLGSVEISKLRLNCKIPLGQTLSKPLAHRMLRFPY